MAKEKIEVKKLNSREMFGYLGGKMVFTPKKAMETLGFTKEDYFSVTIEPMNDDDCQSIRSYNSDSASQFAMWMAEKGKEYTDTMNAYNNNDPMTPEQARLFNEGVEMRRTTTHNTEKLDLVQQYITKLTEPHPEAGKGAINKKAWLRMPPTIKEEIYNEIIDISYMGNDEAINLQ